MAKPDHHSNAAILRTPIYTIYTLFIVRCHGHARHVCVRRARRSERGARCGVMVYGLRLRNTVILSYSVGPVVDLAPRANSKTVLLFFQKSAFSNEDTSDQHLSQTASHRPRRPRSPSRQAIPIETKICRVPSPRDSPHSGRKVMVWYDMVWHGLAWYDMV